MPGLIDAHCHMTFGESMTQEEQDIYTSVEGRTLRAAWNVQKVLSSRRDRGVPARRELFHRRGRPRRDRRGPCERAAHDRGRALHHYQQRPHRLVPGRDRRSRGQHQHPLQHRGRDDRRGTPASEERRRLHQARRQRVRRVPVVPRRGARASSPTWPTSSASGARSTRAATPRSCRRPGGLRLDHARQRHDPRDRRPSGGEEIPLVPTLLLLENWAVYGPSIGSPRPIVDSCRRMLERTRATLHMAREAGVKFVLGTDSGFAMTPYGEWHATELELLMKYAGSQSSRPSPPPPTTPAWS